ncbi:MAG: DNA-binding protein [Bdellovibrionales bacterium GWB1_55_8]|nr:MAG: DNA-binding protein [Bdellovibrionales bacterium GWB1_55_8]
MTKPVNTELLKGSSVTLILSSLDRRDMYGYEIARTLEVASKGSFLMNEGTLYPILHKLEQDGAVASYWEEHEGRRRKYYRLTKSGRTLLSTKQREWLDFKSAMDQVLTFEARLNASWSC